MFLSMAASAAPSQIAVVERSAGIRRMTTYEELAATAAGGARLLDLGKHDAILYVGVNAIAVPAALFAAARAGVPFVPLNYRLSDDQLRYLIERFDRPLIIADEPGRISTSTRILDPGAWMALAAGADPLEDRPIDPDGIAVLLYTSGTTAEPKAAVLRHRHLASYILGTVEFASAGPGQASLVSVPPYHIAAVANILSNLYAGRRLIYLDRFDAQDWLDLAEEQSVTHSMVVPTMLARICDHLDEKERKAPALATISYGGARMPASVITRALRHFPDTGFVNAYGLTETASTIALLAPEDHRAALDSGEPEVRARLGSVGRPLPGVTIGIFDERNNACPPGVRGELRVKGPQVAGEYLGKGSVLSADGWFHTHDRAYIDAGGYLFIEGRMDDTIIRGGENIAPTEIEETILAHPAVMDAGVVGVADEEWGQRIVAHVVPHPDRELRDSEVKEWVRGQLRSSKTPDDVVFRTELPRTDTGKLLRRLL